MNFTFDAVIHFQCKYIAPFQNPCANTPSPPPRYINFFKPFQSWPVNHLVFPIGVSYISSWLQELQSREWEKRTNEQYGLGLTQVQEG